MKKENKFVVIGGQYEPHYYGDFKTELGAKRFANKHQEYWDNWQGWHTPKIYKIEDTEQIFTMGWITYSDGTCIRVPKYR